MKVSSYTYICDNLIEDINNVYGGLHNTRVLCPACSKANLKKLAHNICGCRFCSFRAYMLGKECIKITNFYIRDPHSDLSDNRFASLRCERIYKMNNWSDTPVILSVSKSTLVLSFLASEVPLNISFEDVQKLMILL